MGANSTKPAEVRVLAAITLRDAGDAQELLERSKTVVAASQKEKGCVYYDLHKDRADGNETKFVMWEVWSSMGHLEAHWETEHFKAYVGWVGPKADVAVTTYSPAL